MDAVSLEVFKQNFIAVAEEMGFSLQRTAFSPNIKERLDFSCAVFDAAGHMVAQAAHIPVHLGSMPASVAAALKAFPVLVRGDTVMLNDPYQGGTHLPDITLVSPVYAEGRPVFYVASRAHHADVGGMTAGSLPLSRELYQEGLIIPPVKLQSAGQTQEGILALLTANSRTPEERLGDIRAQLAAHHVGAERLTALIARFGLASVLAHAQALQDYSLRLTQAVIRAIPDGEYVFQDALEGDGQSETFLPIQVCLQVMGDRLRVDFSGTAAQTLGNLNAVAAVARSAVWYSIRLLSEGDIPVNQGCFAPIEVLTPEGSLLNPRPPAAVAVGNTETSQRVVDVVLGALALALPERIPAASQGTMNNITFGGLWEGRPFVYYETLAGGHGGGPQGDGLSGRHSHMTNTLNTPIEALERVLPVRIRAYSLRQNAGGQGRGRGGAGLIRTYEFLAPVTLTLNTERRRLAPYGLAGGGQGAVGLNILIRGGQETILPAKCTLHLEAGDCVRIETPGGGGWGVP